jgi:hypothetical protein
VGWVRNRFTEQALYDAKGSAVLALWNQMRDDIGQAVLEFNEQSQDTVEHKPCTANGEYCIRIHRSINNSSIEVYLNPKGHTLCVSRGTPGSQKRICGYRVTEDRKELEFCGGSKDVPEFPMSTECACELAIGDFLFIPRPRMVQTTTA